LRTFPDCIARRNGEEIGIEFEVLASDFYDHRHNEHSDLARCKLLMCWKNNLKETVVKDGRSFIIVNGCEIEVLALNEIVAKLREKGIVLIVNGERPDIGRANMEGSLSSLRKTLTSKSLDG